MATSLISKIETNLQKAEIFLFQEEIEPCFTCCETIEQLIIRLKMDKQGFDQETNYAQKLAGIKRGLNRIMVAKVKANK